MKQPRLRVTAYYRLELDVAQMIQDYADSKGLDRNTAVQELVRIAYEQVKSDLPKQGQ